MRILYNHYHTDAEHPAVAMVRHVAAGLRSCGHDVLVHASAGVCSTHAGGAGKTLGSESKAVNPSSWTSRAKRCLWFARAMNRNKAWIARDKRAISEFSPDIVLTRQDAYSWSMTKAASVAGVPIVTYADAPVAYETRCFNGEARWHPPYLVERLEKWGLAKSRAIITVSNPAARQLGRYELPVPIHVNHNGVDIARFPVLDGDERNALKRELFGEQKTVIGFQGTFKAFHGVDRLRDLILATEQFSDVAWLLIGDGPQRGSLERAVRHSDTVKFLGRKKPEEMGKWLAAADIAVAPHSRMRGEFYFCPLKILEYAAAGCATLASSQGDIPTLLANGKGGEIVDRDDVADWIKALEKLISNPSYSRKLGKQAQHHVRHHLTWEQTALRTEKVLCEVMGIPSAVSDMASHSATASEHQEFEVAR